ncbi:EAL domain-containing protein [Persephonella sp.]
MKKGPLIGFFTGERLLNLVVPLIFLFLGVVVYFYLPHIERALNNTIVRAVVNMYDEITDNAINTLQADAGGKLIDGLSTDRELYEKARQVLGVVVGSQITYLFIIYRDSNVYRFLIDLSRADTAQKGEIFIPTIKELEILGKIYRTGKKEVVYHQDTDRIGITLIKPIRENGQVRAFLFMDFSVGLIQSIRNVVKFFGVLSLVVIGISLTFIMLTVYFFLKTVYLRSKAYRDSLTGVYNRNYLNELLNFIDISSYAIVLVDIDYFKKINDTFGHEAGDRILREVAQILKKSVRTDEDYIIRFGGEEFLILLKKDRKKTGQILNAIRRIFQNIRAHRFIINGNPIKLTISAGIYDGPVKDFEEALRKADSALYRAKKEGRDRFEFYVEDSGFPYIVQINEIVEKDSIIFDYQPVVELTSGKILYLEALVRLKDTRGYLLTPDRFIDTVRDTFIYSKISRKVILHNMDILKKHRHITVGINVLPSDISNESIITMLLEQDTDLINRTVIEIVETEEAGKYRSLIENINLLKNAGYRIAMDDFGSGYSNFEYLTKIDMDYLKFNSGLISQIVDNNRSARLIQMVVQFCKEEGIDTIAEFIESPKIYSAVRHLGIKYGQGFYLYRPDRLENFLKPQMWLSTSVIQSAG